MLLANASSTPQPRFWQMSALHHLLLESTPELSRLTTLTLSQLFATCRAQDFEKAGSLRDREMELKSQISAITSSAKDSQRAEMESGEGGGPMVTEQDIANIVAQWTGIPIEKVSSDETERLIKMEQVLHGRVIGQEEAVTAISRAIRRARVGLKNPSRPIASFIFSGTAAAACLRVLFPAGRLPLGVDMWFAALLMASCAPCGLFFILQDPLVWASRSWPRPWPAITLALRRPWCGWT
jgi:hypothetical protein